LINFYKEKEKKNIFRFNITMGCRHFMNGLNSFWYLKC